MSLASIAARPAYVENLPTTETLEQVQRELASACAMPAGTVRVPARSRIVVTPEGWGSASKEVA